MQHYLFPRLRDFLFIILLIGGIISGPRMINTDSDLGRNLTVGNYILTSHHVPTTDLLSFTRAGESRPPYEWLADVVFALAYRLLNLDGVVLLSSLVIAAAFAFVYSDAVHRSAAPILALVVTIWAALASSLHWLARPHVFSFLFFAIWVAMLDRLRRGEQQPIWQFPLLMLVWANTHGGFLFGFLAFAAYAAGWLFDFWRKQSDVQLGKSLLIVGGSSLITSVLTPDLWGNWTATLNNRSSFVLSRTVETMPLNLASFNAWPFLGLFALAIGLMILNRKRFVAAHGLLLAGFALMSFLMARNVPFFVISAAPICSFLLAPSTSKLSLWVKLEDGFSAIDHSLYGIFWSVLSVMIAVALFFYHLQGTGKTVFHWDPSVLPVSATSWLIQNPQPGHMFNDLNWGGYLILRVWPGQQVFVDSQTDFYGEPFLRQYVAILAGAPGWDAELRQYGVDWLLIPPSSPLADLARQSPRWKIAYQDSTAIILSRR